MGANIGTTCTAFTAAIVTGSKASIQISLCHLLFNIFGILIWYPYAEFFLVCIFAAAISFRVSGVATLVLTHWLTGEWVTKWATSLRVGIRVMRGY